MSHAALLWRLKNDVLQMVRTTACEVKFPSWTYYHIPSDLCQQAESTCHSYTKCFRQNVPHFRRTFLRSNFAITKNTHTKSQNVTQIMA